MSRGEDVVRPDGHLRRRGEGKPCFPVKGDGQKGTCRAEKSVEEVQ